MTILTTLCTIFSVPLGSNLMGSRGGAFFGMLGLIAVLELVYVLAQRFTQCLAFAIVYILLWIAGFVVRLVPDTRKQCIRGAYGNLFGIIDSTMHPPT